MGINIIYGLLVSTAVVTLSDSHPTGAPSEACEQMRPHHPPTTTFGVAPFVIDVDDLYYTPGSVVTGISHMSD